MRGVYMKKVFQNRQRELGYIVLPSSFRPAVVGYDLVVTARDIRKLLKSLMGMRTIFL